MAGWRQYNGHEFEQTPGISERQARLVCYSPWGSKQVDTTQPLNNTTFLNSIISSKTWGLGFFVFSLGLSAQIIRLSANSSSFMSFFLIFKNFISFSCLISLPRTFSTTSNRSSESEYPCLVPSHKRKTFSFSLLVMIFS